MEQETTLRELDLRAKEIQDLRLQYEEAKDKASEIHAAYKSKESEYLALLKANGKEKYFVEGVGTLYIHTSESYKLPADTEAKLSLFEYIKNKYGQDVLNAMITIHSAKLNSWANQEVASGDVMDIPGLDMPTVYEEVRLRKERK